jgi:uncharacterized membrane protein
MLLVLMLAIAAMRVYLPVGAKIEGKPLGVITLSFRERLLVQRTNLYLIGIVILMGALSGFLTGPLELVAILATIAVLTIPVRYRVTSQGVALNNVVFRSWTDFRGYREERASVVLDAVEGQRNFRMHLLGANRDVAVKALGRVLARSAAGQKPGGARAGGRVRP